MKSLLIALIFFITISTIASPLTPADLTPTQCRWRCQQSPGGAWCIHLIKNAYGLRPVIDPFMQLMISAHHPQKYVSCGQETTIGDQDFSIVGEKCEIEKTGPVDEIFKTTLPGNTTGRIVKNSHENVDLVFTNEPPKWRIDIFNPSIGENEVQFLTHGKDDKGLPITIWFDRYFCYAVEKD